jgi:membrane protein required for colicin V production
MNVLDIVIIGVIVLSGLFAFARGFVKEALSIVGWLGATAFAVYALPWARPIAERYLPKGAVAEAAAAGVIFVVTLIVLSILTGGISRRVRGSSLSALDRTLGLIFGLMRGALLVCIGYIGLSFVLPQNGERPRWISESRTLPLVASTTDSLSHLLPQSFRNQAQRFQPASQRESDYLSVLRAYSVPGAKPGAALPSIAPEDQKRLNQLIQQLGGSSDPEGPGKMIQVPQGR